MSTTSCTWYSEIITWCNHSSWNLHETTPLNFIQSKSFYTMDRSRYLYFNREFGSWSNAKHTLFFLGHILVVGVGGSLIMAAFLLSIGWIICYLGWWHHPIYTMSIKIPPLDEIIFVMIAVPLVIYMMIVLPLTSSAFERHVKKIRKTKDVTCVMIDGSYYLRIPIQSTDGFTFPPE